MADRNQIFPVPPHDHVFLGSDHDRAERRTWAVIILCTMMMVAEIVGGALFGSLALIADGLHMSTHAGALLLAALAYTYARKYAGDRSFTFGTGKFGDLAGYSSAIVLAMISLLIAYEAVMRFLNPVAIAFNEAIPIAALGLVVNAASAWLLSGGHHREQGHGHSHGHAHDHDHDGAPRRLEFRHSTLEVEVFDQRAAALSYQGGDRRLAGGFRSQHRDRQTGRRSTTISVGTEGRISGIARRDPGAAQLRCSHSPDAIR
jgi:hypothetical protein